MIDKTTLIKVRNRDNGTVGYTIPDLGNLHRNFQVGETKEVTMEELRKLSYIPGGMYLLQNCFIIENKEAVAELLGAARLVFAEVSLSISTAVSALISIALVTLNPVFSKIA